MKTVELVPHISRPVDDREGHLPFEPFTLTEWLVTIVLALVVFGIPLGMILQYHAEQARLDAAAVTRVAHE